MTNAPDRIFEAVRTAQRFVCILRDDGRPDIVYQPEGAWLRRAEIMEALPPTA